MFSAVLSDVTRNPVSYPQQPYQGQQAQQQGYQSQPGYAGQPSYGAPAYPPQQPAYPPQQPPPPQYAPPQQQYFQPPPQQQYQVPPGYGMLPQGPPPPQQEQVRGTLQGFMDQPSSGNNSLTFMALGTRYIGTVIRSVTDADIQPQTDMITGAVGTYSDGRVKLVMKIPLMVQPSAQFPDGTATWYVKGHDRDELTRAMEAAGVETDPATGRLFPPRAGDMIDVTYVSDRPGKRGMNPTKVKRVAYTKGNGIAPQVPQQVQQAQPVQAEQQWNPQQQFLPPGAFTVTPPGVYNYAQTITPGTATQPLANQYYNYTATTPGMPDPHQGYQQATGQQMPPQGQQLYQQQYAQPQGQQPGFQPQQPGPAAPTAQPQFTNGAMPTGPAFPSNEPPPDWPAGVPFIPGLTPQQAAVAATMHHPAASPVQ